MSTARPTEAEIAFHDSLVQLFFVRVDKKTKHTTTLDVSIVESWKGLYEPLEHCTVHHNRRAKTAVCTYDDSDTYPGIGDTRTLYALCGYITSDHCWGPNHFHPAI